MSSYNFATLLNNQSLTLINVRIIGISGPHTHSHTYSLSLTHTHSHTHAHTHHTHNAKQYIHTHCNYYDHLELHTLYKPCYRTPNRGEIYYTDVTVSSTHYLYASVGAYVRRITVLLCERCRLECQLSLWEVGRMWIYLYPNTCHG